jgi:hypothetical protein
MPLWPKARSVTAVALLLGAVAISAVPGMKLLAVFYLVPLTAAFVSLAVLSCVATALAARRANWPVAILEGAFVSAVVATVLQPQLFVTPLRTTSNYIQLAITYPMIKTRVESWPPDQTPRVLIFETDGFLSGASGLAFDDSDEISKAPGSQSDAWKARISNSPLGMKCWQATRLIGSYYAWSGEYACE